jgi:hypothetical protein
MIENWLSAHWVAIGIGLVLAYFLWIGSGVLEAVLDVKRRPREPMFWCTHHGYFRQKHVLPIPGMTDVCPICYHEAWKKAENR